jgi:integrase
VAVCTGLRRGELTSLRWRNVRLTGSDPFLEVLSGNGFDTKSGHGRTVPLAADALAVLTRRQAERPNEDPAAYVFPGDRGGQLNGDRLSQAFKAATREAGLPEAIHFHSLRHTCASWLAMRGVSLYLIADVLGHASTQVTQRYAHLAPGAAHAAVRAALEPKKRASALLRRRRRARTPEGDPREGGVRGAVQGSSGGGAAV